MTTRRRRGGGRRRGVEWFDRTVNSTLTASNQVGIDLSTDLSNVNRKGATVVRMLLDITLQPVTIDVNLRSYMGIYMAELDAFNASNFPEVAVDDEQPGWMYRMMRNVRTHDVDQLPANSHIEVDVRAKRRFVGEDTLLTLVLERDAAVGGVLFTGMVRTLVMRP